MYESLLRYPTDLFSEFERMQREMDRLFGTWSVPTSIRAVARGAFPAVNIGTSPKSVEVYAFAPGIDPAKLEVSVDRGLLTISGERASDLPEESDKVSIYADERFAGSFKRVVSEITAPGRQAFGRNKEPVAVQWEAAPPKTEASMVCSHPFVSVVLGNVGDIGEFG